MRPRIPAVLLVLTLAGAATAAATPSLVATEAPPQDSGAACAGFFTDTFLNQVEEDPVEAFFNAFSYNLNCQELSFVWRIIDDIIHS